jgi:hypothetical protein
MGILLTHQARVGANDFDRSVIATARARGSRGFPRQIRRVLNAQYGKAIRSAGNAAYRSGSIYWIAASAQSLSKTTNKDNYADTIILNPAVATAGHPPLSWPDLIRPSSNLLKTRAVPCYMDGPVKPGHDSACVTRWVLRAKGRSALSKLATSRQAPRILLRRNE